MLRSELNYYSALLFESHDKTGLWFFFASVKYSQLVCITSIGIYNCILFFFLSFIFSLSFISFLAWLV